MQGRIGKVHNIKKKFLLIFKEKSKKLKRNFKNTENIIEYGKKIDENRKKEHNSRNTKEQTMKSKNSLSALFYFMNEKEGN